MEFFTILLKSLINFIFITVLSVTLIICFILSIPLIIIWLSFRPYLFNYELNINDNKNDNELKNNNVNE